MPLLTIEQLRRIMPHAKTRADVFLSHINATLEEFEINTPRRISAFLAQLAHESGELRYVEEIASGVAYEGRADLGNTQRGDGMRFKGRGLIQITGRANYLACSKYFGVDFVEDPAKLAAPEWAVRSAGWFWQSRRLNSLADLGDFRAITKKINGGYNGEAQREAYYKAALASFETEQITIQPLEVKPMLPAFIAAALPTLLNAAPDLIRVFGKGEQSEKNAQAAAKVVEIAKVVTGETTAEGAVAKIQADPAMSDAFSAEARAQFLEIEAMAEKRIAAAREFNKSDEPMFGRVKFVHILSLMVACAALAGIGYILTTSTDPTERSMALQTLLIGGFSGVLAYWIGSSQGSDKKTDLMRGPSNG